MSIDRWMDKGDVMYTYNGILLSHVIRSNMDLTQDYHTKWSKSEKQRQIPYDTLYKWNLKYDKNELIYKAETETWKTNLWLPQTGEGVEEG